MNIMNSSGVGLSRVLEVDTNTKPIFDVSIFGKIINTMQDIEEKTLNEWMLENLIEPGFLSRMSWLGLYTHEVEWSKHVQDYRALISKHSYA